MTEADLENIARVAHEAVRAHRAGLNEDSIPPWSRAPRWMRRATLEGVQSRLANPNAPPAVQHDQWLAEKRMAGWREGPVRDETLRTHPMMIPYDDLPETERRKDVLFGSVVRALGAPLA